MPMYRKHTEEERYHISVTLKGKPKTQEHRRHLSLALKGKRRSPATEFKKGTIPFYASKQIPLDVRAKLSAANEGKHSSPETEYQIGHAPTRGMTGKSAWNKGQPCSEETKNKIRSTENGRHLHPETEIKRGQRISRATEFTSERVRSWWKDPDYRNKVIAGRLRKRRPTGPERQVINIVEKYNLPFKYTGDGSFILEGLNPDFIETNGRKIAIDVFGDYWHTLKADKDYYTEEGRSKIFAKYGWRLIILWEHEINTMDEKDIVELLKRGCDASSKGVRQT